MATTSGNEDRAQSWGRWPKLLPPILTGLAVLLLGYMVIETLDRLWQVIAPVFVPLLISLALAYILEPLVEGFEAYRFSRRSATLFTMLMTVLVLTIILLFLVPSFWFQLSDIVAKLPGNVKSAADWVQAELTHLERLNPAFYNKISKQVDDYVHNPTGVTEPVVNFIKNGIGQVGSITASVLNLILIPLFVYYILVDFERLSSTFYQAVPPRHRAATSELFRQVDGVLRNFVRGQLLVCSAMAALYVIGFLLLRVPMGFTLGILSGFGHLVPYLGTASAAILVVGFTALNSPKWWQLIAVIAMYPLVQGTEGFILTPRILGEKLELHPFLVLVGVIIGHHLFGILGIILAAPGMACAKVFLTFFYRRYLASSFYSRLSPQPIIAQPIVAEPEVVEPAAPAQSAEPPSLVRD